MDTLTHALSGMLSARASVNKPVVVDQNHLSLRARLIAGFFAAAFPDSDIVMRLFGSLAYLENHRGVTHSILMMPFWALLLAWCFSLLSRKRYTWQAFYAVSALGITMHILGDVITSFGTMILSPLTNAKFAMPTTFIIDFYFTGIILTALISAAIFRQHSRRIAIAGMVVLVSYIGYQGTLHHKAIAIGEAYAQQQQYKDYDVYAMPQPFSPYHWKVMIKNGESYAMSYLNLMSKEKITASADAGLFEKLDALYLPISQQQWTKVSQYGGETSQLAREVWQMAIMQPIREFMLFPAVDQFTAEDTQQCVWFQDHRFVLDGIRQGPFRFGACRETDNEWKLFRLREGVKVPLFD